VVAIDRFFGCEHFVFLRATRRMMTLFCLTFLATVPAWSQKKLVDSLHTELRNLESSGISKPDIHRINLLNELAFAYQRINPDSSLLLSERSLALSEEAGHVSGKVEALRNTGIVYYVQGDFNQALNYFYDALRIADEIQYEKGIARLYNNLGLIFYGQGKYEEALDAQFNSLTIKERINDTPGIATSLNNIANIYKNQGKYDESLIYHLKSLEVKQALKDDRAVAASLNNIAWLYINQQNYREAMVYFVDAEQLNREVQDKVIGSDIAQGKAECYLYLKDYPKALRFANESLHLAYSIKLKDQLRDGSETLSKIYKAMGNYQRALYHYEIFKAYADSINNAEIEERSAFLKAQYEYEKREAQLKAQQDEINNEYARRRLQQNWLIFSVLAGLASATLVAFLIFRSRKNLQQAYKQLEQVSEELQTQKEEIEAQRDVMADQNLKLMEAGIIIELKNKEIGARMEGLETEVEKRTRELLDYNQQLEQFAFISAHNLRAPVATILGLSNVLGLSKDPSEKQEVYERMVATAQDLDRVVGDLNTILDIRKNSNTVRSEINLEETFQPLLSSLSEEISKSNASIDADFSKARQVTCVKPYLDSVLYNLISNAIKYRHPERNPVINVMSEVRNGFVCITFTDNGLGIDLNLFKDKVFKLYSRFHTHVEGKGLGLHMIKTQLAAMGGKIEVESQVNEGTTFRVYIPLR
jgi:signal transduction histidine kinase